MARLAAVGLLALLSVATAERSLLAHKASGGTSLHALALTGTGYYTSNGNGTWTARTNSAYQAQANCYGSSTANAGPLTTYFVKGGGSITDVHFPSRLVGIAVGAGCSGGSTAYTDSTTGAAVSAVAVGAASLNYIPQILLTFDMGTTWQYATGFSSKPKSFAQTLQLATNQPLGATLADTTVANPSPDLLSVHCATRSLCFAAGGYFATEATRTGYVAVTAANPSATYVTGKVDAMVSPAPATGLPAIKANVMPVAGAVLVSTNGGTVWSYVTLPNAQPATSTLPAQPIPGLTDISSDASGRHVFAVGAPFFKFDFAFSVAANREPYSIGTNVANGAIYGAATSVANPAAAGTIIYSGSYGASNSWSLQTAPYIPNHWYSLSAVTVLRGTVAVAVGGSPFGLSLNAFNNSITGAPTPAPTVFSYAAAAALRPSGVVLMTMNGGFRWMYQNLPSWSYWSQVYPTAAGTYVYDTVEQGDAMLPALNDVACYQSTDSTSGLSSYSCFAVGDFGYMVRATIPYSSLSSGVIASQTPTWSYVNVTQVAQQTGFLDFYGISWDNNVVGYAFGRSFIVSTHDGGNTWVSETPPGIVTGSSISSDVTAISTVPTTY